MFKRKIKGYKIRIQLFSSKSIYNWSIETYTFPKFNKNEFINFQFEIKSPGTIITTAKDFTKQNWNLKS